MDSSLFVMEKSIFEKNMALYCIGIPVLWQSEKDFVTRSTLLLSGVLTSGSEINLAPGPLRTANMAALFSKIKKYFKNAQKETLDNL